MATTIGKILVNEALPDDMRDDARVLDKKGAQALFQELAERYPERYIDILQRTNNIARMVATEYGGEASLSLEDFRIPEKVKQYRDGVRKKIHNISQDRLLTPEQKEKAIVSLVRKTMPEVQKLVEEEALKGNNAFAKSIAHGYRGSPVQLTQLLYGDQLSVDHKGRIQPVPGLHSYSEGTTLAEYWASSYSARKAFTDVQFSTAASGFLGKQVAHMSQKLKITGKDCGLPSEVGTIMDGDDPDIIGHVLQREVNGLPAGHVIRKNDLKIIRGKKPLVRATSTCQQKDGGICQKCAGAREQGRFPSLGTYIGIGSARILTEPLTQLGLSSKHTGGLVEAETNKEVTGFDEVNQFLQVPKTFRGASTLAPLDGKVSLIKKAPQGGQFIRVGGETVYAPPGREVQVAVGDVVEAGDMLTDGSPNPAEIARYKGLGEGRRYFTQKFYEILRDNGVASHRRNVDTVARAFFDKVDITKDGAAGFTIGDTVSYVDIQRTYKPREGHAALAPSRAHGQYLERPVLHYTIGTRITPKVSKFLKQEGIQEILVHKDPAGFEPKIMRAMDHPGKERDWKTQLTGFGLKKSLLESAQRGSVSPHKNLSPATELMDPMKL
jgi:DNA-directed RNA polymerase subunit beta'